MSMIKSMMIGCARGALYAAQTDTGIDDMSYEDLEGDTYRQAFRDTEGRDINLTDEAIAVVIRGTDDDMEPEQWVALFKKAEQAADDVGITAMVGQASAIAMAKEIDKEFNLLLEDCLDAERRKKMTAVDVYEHLVRIYIHKDAKGKVVKNELDTAPIPGTDKDDCGNRRPDNYTVKDANGKVINGSWWNDFADNSSKGKPFNDAIVDIKKAKANSKDANKAYAGFDEDQLDAMLASATADRNALRNMVKRGAAFYYQLEAVNAMTNVKVRFIMQKDEVTPMRGPKPLWLHSTIDPSKGKVLSVTQFLNLKPAKVGIDATRADLLATMGRDTDAGENEESIADVEDADESIADLANFFDKRDNMTAFLKELAKPVDESGDLRMSVIALYHALTPIVKKYNGWYQSAISQGLDEKETKVA